MSQKVNEILDLAKNLSDSDKHELFVKLYNQTPNHLKREESVYNQFYVDICRAYNAGKVNMKGRIKNSEGFKSSNDYYVQEFGELKLSM